MGGLLLKFMTEARSAEVLNFNERPTMRYNLPFRTRGDENCLYRACSGLLCSKEDLCYLLRDLTSIELFTNQECYAFHPYIKEKSILFKTERVLLTQP